MCPQKLVMKSLHRTHHTHDAEGAVLRSRQERDDTLSPDHLKRHPEGTICEVVGRAQRNRQETCCACEHPWESLTVALG